MYKNTPKTFYMGGATPTDRTMINRGVFFMGGADSSSGGWHNKPASWPDIRKNLIPNSIRLLADERYPLGFTATATGGYKVKIDGEDYNTYSSGAQCSIPQTDWPKGHIDSLTAYGATEQSGTPTPTTPQDIVSNNGVLKVSKNLFDKNASYALFDGFVNRADVGQETILVAYSGGDKTIIIKVAPNTTYTVTRATNLGSKYNRIRCAAFTTLPVNQSRGVIIYTIGGTTEANATFTTLSDTQYVAINVRDSGEVGNDWTQFIDAFQLEKGSTATPYMPYGAVYTDGTQETITDNLSNTATAEMLLKVGDYQDVQSVLDGAVTRNVGIKVLNGTENWEVPAGTSGFYSLRKTNFIPAPISSSSTAVVCSHASAASIGGTPGPQTCGFGASFFNFNLNGDNSAVLDFKTWLATQYNAGTPVIVVYPLATPTTETVTPQALTGTTATVTAGSIDNLQITYTNAESGYPIDYPTGAETAHIVDIYPTTEGNDITAFHCARVAASGTELQGVLWAHFNLSNRIVAGHQTFSGGAFYNTTYHNNMIKAVTAKNNLLKITYFNQFVGENLSLEYVPIFESNLSNDLWIAGTAGGCKKITVKNYVCDNRRFDYSFCSCSELENVILKNCTISPSNLTAAFNDCFKLKKVPETIDYSNATNMTSYLYRNNSLEDTVLDVSAATGLTKIGCGSTSQYFMSGFKGLRVSNQAPFNNATAPQINVSYTGMDRQAIITLFNDLPTVSDGQIINITGCTGASNLTGDDMDIAINKGWTITGSRDYVIENGILTWANPNVYLKSDGNSCILTDYAPSYKTSMDIKVGDVNTWICGARFSAGYVDFGIAYYLATYGKNVLEFQNISSGTYTFHYGQTLIRNGVTIGTFPETSSVGNVKMLLFGIRTEGNSNMNLSRGKIYYCKIYDEGSLVYHFVPVPQGLEIGNFTCPSNGMFDIVNQQFYANTGTGTFSYGKDS